MSGSGKCELTDQCGGLPTVGEVVVNKRKLILCGKVANATEDLVKNKIFDVNLPPPFGEHILLSPIVWKLDKNKLCIKELDKMLLMLYQQEEELLTCNSNDFQDLMTACASARTVEEEEDDSEEDSFGSDEEEYEDEDVSDDDEEEDNQDCDESDVDEEATFG